MGKSAEGGVSALLPLRSSAGSEGGKAGGVGGGENTNTEERGGQYIDDGVGQRIPARRVSDTEDQIVADGIWKPRARIQQPRTGRLEWHRTSTSSVLLNMASAPCTRPVNHNRR